MDMIDNKMQDSQNQVQAQFGQLELTRIEMRE